MRTLIHLFLMLTGPFAAAQKTDSEVTVSYLDHPDLLMVNFDTEALHQYFVAVEDTLDAFLSETDLGMHLEIQQVFDANLAPQYFFSSRPELPDSLRIDLHNRLREIPPVVSRFLPFAVRYTILINGGCQDRGVVYKPALKTIRDQRQQVYKKADLKAQFSLIQTWLKKGGIPLLESLIKSPHKTDFNPKKFKSNPAYYYSLLETVQNPGMIVPVLKTFIFASEGRFTYARAYMTMLYQFVESNELLRYLLDELDWRMRFYLTAEKFKTDLVLSQYTTKDSLVPILAINPNSEHLLKTLTNDEIPYLVSHYPTFEYRQRYLESNPIRQTTLTPWTKKEAYDNHLRNTASNLFIDAESFATDFPRYGEIALELSAYEFATTYYWLLSHFNNRIENLPEMDYTFYYHYSLFKRGIKTDFDKKALKGFKRLDKKFRKRMKKHEVYKNFNP